MQIQVTPEQIPALIHQHEAELSAVEKVLACKMAINAKLDEMESNIAANNLSAALCNFIEIQRIEYALNIEGLNEKRKQITMLLEQLRSPIQRPAPGLRLPTIS